MEQVMIAIAVGFLAGAISGLIGVGGGIILTPFLHYVVGKTWIDSVALSLLVIAIQSPVGVWRHARKGLVNWKLATLLSIAGAAGVWAGDLALPKLQVPMLKLLMAGLMGFAAWRLGKKAIGKLHLESSATLGIGLMAGFISRVLGVGGGIITVPSLAVFGVAAHVAVASSLVAVFTNAALASGANLARGMPWVEGVVLAGGAIAGTFVGTMLAHRLDEAKLRRVVAVALLAVGASVAIEALRNLL